MVGFIQIRKSCSSVMAVLVFFSWDMARYGVSKNGKKFFPVFGPADNIAWSKTVITAPLMGNYTDAMHDSVAKNKVYIFLFNYLKYCLFYYFLIGFWAL